MKTGILPLVPFFLVLCLPLSAADEAASIKPEKPKMGDKITISYDESAKRAVLRHQKGITAELMAICTPEAPILYELPMKKKGNIWTATMTLTEKRANLLLLRFTASDKTDDNGENVWHTLVHGTDGQPVRNGYLSRATFLNRSGIMEHKHSRDADGAKRDLEAELMAYPDNIQARTMMWSMAIRETPGKETKARIKEELAALYEKNRESEEAVASLLSWFEQTDQKERAKEIRTENTGRNPKGIIAKNSRANDIYQERDPNKRIELINAYLTDFQLKDSERDQMRTMLINAHIQNKEPDKAGALLLTLSKQDGSIYNQLAWGLIEKGEQLEKGVEWAKKGVDLLRKPDPASKPSYYSMKNWNKNNAFSLGMVLDTYAYGLMQLGKLAEAEKAFGEAYAATEGEQVEINERYLACCVKAGNIEKALRIGVECLRKGKTSDPLVATFKEAYTKKHGSADGVEQAIQEARDDAKKEIRKKLLKERINKPAIDFTLKDLDGKSVSLSGLKGKVIVIDFWATWCGPCKSSFPYLQQVYDTYKSNDRVAIYAVDTWENVQGEEREKLVRKFMADNKYTFPVLYDENIVEKYGVTGIPTKFIVGRDGNLQFKSIGFSGGQEMIDELTLQIELLLSDDVSSAH